MGKVHEIGKQDDSGFKLLNLVEITSESIKLDGLDVTGWVMQDGVIVEPTQTGGVIVTLKLAAERVALDVESKRLVQGVRLLDVDFPAALRRVFDAPPSSN